MLETVISGFESESGSADWLTVERTSGFDPGAVRRALLELQGVFPATHLEISLPDVVASAAADGNWLAFLQGTGRWSELIAELSQAIGDAVRDPAVWGVGLPVSASGGKINRR